MKRHLAHVMLASALFALGCAGNDVVGTGDATNVDDGPTASSAAPLNTELRIRGFDASHYQLAYFGLSGLRVAVDGHDVASEVEAPKIDLTNLNQAWLAGKFALPPNSKTVQVALTLDEFGAFAGIDWSRQMPNLLDAGEVRVDDRPLTFTAKVAQMKNPKLVLLVDVNLSLAVDGTGVRRFVPQIELAY